jgi:hypothetical protein
VRVPQRPNRVARLARVHQRHAELDAADARQRVHAQRFGPEERRVAPP